MPFNREKFLLAVGNEVNNRQIVEELTKSSGCFDRDAAPPQQAKALARLMQLIDQRVAPAQRLAVMHNCNCLGETVVVHARRLYAKSHDLDEWLEHMNAANIGGGQLSREGHTITARYTRCYCGSVSQTTQPMSLTYCLCSCGWFKDLFEAVLEVPVHVDVHESIIHGDSQCRFAIQLPSYALSGVW